MIAFLTCGEFHFLPIKRLAAYTVFSALVMAWRLAMCPTSRFPASVTATTLGVVLYPPRFGMTTGVSPSKIATQEFVVPRSMPITRSILSPSHHQAARPSSLAAFESPYPIADCIILGRQRRGALEFRQPTLLHAGRDVDPGECYPGLNVFWGERDGTPSVLAREPKVALGQQSAIGGALEGPGDRATERGAGIRARGV